MIEYRCEKCKKVKECDKLPEMDKWFVCPSCKPLTIEELRNILNEN